MMIKREVIEGVTDLADFEEVIYKIEDEDLYMIATSEHPIGGYHMDEIIEKTRRKHAPDWDPTPFLPMPE